ncbi:LCP family protein [Aquipuribacter sp. MA13-6]|uniref:LytR C-terminal domain-containing protein n=1 Tax=unclassified Aquipuribacter TaxID=2635084 RepID=UPI003EEB12B0
MPDDDRPDVPDGAGDTGVQRALGERRRRRLAERSGQVDLDATMSHWPVTDPPAAPRPVVRPARPTVAGVATEPAVPPPGQLVVGPLVEARRAGDATGPTAVAAGGRRSRRRAAAGPVGDGPGPGPAGPGATGPGPAGPGAAADPATGGGATNILAGGAGRSPSTSPDPVDAGAGSSPGEGYPRSGRRSAADQASPFPPGPSPTPSPVRPGRRDDQGATASRDGSGPRRPRLSWPPGPLELGLAAAAVAVVLLVVVLLAGLLDGQDDTAALAPAAGAATQQTSALTLTGPDGAVAAAAVLGVDSARLSTLLLPADLLLTVADAGDVSLSQAVALGPEAVRRGLEDTLLLRVDQVVLLQPQQVATLVDAAGGVVLDVGTQVVTDDVVVAAGEDQRLSGAQAVAYATLQADGEPVETGLARFGDVLAALLEALPQEQDAAATALAAAQVSAGASGGGDGAGPEALPALVATAAQRSGSGSTQAVVLPTTEVTAGQTDLRGVDEGSVEAALGTRFAGARLPVAAVGDVRVVVRNGTGGSGLVGRARDLLVGAGLRYSGGGNAAQFGQESTAVLVASEEPEDRAQGEAVALALGVPEGALQVNAEAMVDTDVVVVLGDDFAAATQDDPSSPTEPTTGDLP